MFPNRAALGLLSRRVPVSICSPSLVLRSQIISAPVQVAERFTAASQIASIAGDHISAAVALSAPGRKSKFAILVRPSFSMIRLSSGWKRITTASMPHWKKFFSRYLIA